MGDERGLPSEETIYTVNKYGAALNVLINIAFIHCLSPVKLKC